MGTGKISKVYTFFCNLECRVCADIFSSLATFLDLVTVIQGLGERKTCQRHGLVVEKYTYEAMGKWQGKVKYYVFQ